MRTYEIEDMALRAIERVEKEQPQEDDRVELKAQWPEDSAYCKTSGKRGLHVYVPFGARYSHDQAKHFAELIAVHSDLRAVPCMDL
jgi:hypothetical protein